MERFFRRSDLRASRLATSEGTSQGGLREVSPVPSERTQLLPPTHTDATPGTQETGYTEYWEACYAGFKKCFGSSCLREATTQDTSPPATQDAPGGTVSEQPPRTDPMLPLRSSSDSEGSPSPSQLSLGSRGKGREIRDVATSTGFGEDKTSTYFYRKCISLLERKEISVPGDLQEALDRHMEIDRVKAQWGSEFAKVFAYVRGLVTEKKSEQLYSKTEDTASKFKKYETKARLSGDGQIYLSSHLGERNECMIYIDLERGDITLPSCKREKGSDALQLSEHLGELWLYALSKVKNKEDDYNQIIKIDSLKAENCVLNRLIQNNINNKETKSTFLLIFRDELTKFQSEIRRGDKKSTTSETILIDRDTEREKSTSILGTPNGYAGLFLPKHYKFASQERSVAKIEIKFSIHSPNKPIDEMDQFDISIREMNFVFDQRDQ